MLQMSLIGLCVGFIRIFAQRKNMLNWTLIEKIRTAIVYCSGMMLLFATGTGIMRWIASIVNQALLQYLLFIVIFFVMFLAIHIVMATLLPKGSKRLNEI